MLFADALPHGLFPVKTQILLSFFWDKIPDFMKSTKKTHIFLYHTI